MKKLKPILIISALFFAIVFNMGFYPVFSVPVNSCRFVVNKIEKGKNSLILNGNFINGSKSRISNVKDLNITIKNSKGVVIATAVFNDNRLNSIDMLPGTNLPWKFVLYDKKFNSVNTKNLKVTSTFSNLTEYNNTSTSGIHVFYNNNEVNFENKPFLDSSNTLYVPVEILYNINVKPNLKKPNFVKASEGDIDEEKKPAKKPKKAGRSGDPNTLLLKQFPKLKKHKLFIINNMPYIDLSTFNSLLKPKYTYYLSQDDGYYSIIILK